MWPQVGLAMLAAVFPDDDCKIKDCIAEDISYKDLYDYMCWYKPTWVVFNPVATTFSHDMIVAHYAKSLGAMTVAISPQIKACKEETHARFKSLDYSVEYTKGGYEPEYQLRELIKGISPVGTGFRTIPSARQDLLPLAKYNMPIIGGNYTFIVTSRGCPWKCIYCRQGVMNESIVRYRPVETCLKEIEMYGLKRFALHADTSTVSASWMVDFCHGLPKGVKWICSSRVDTVTRALLATMKKAGCFMIFYGCESGNDKVLEMNKKEATVEQAKQAIRWSKEVGLQVWGYFMLGMYGDTAESMEQTIRFACKEPFDVVNFAIAAPYSGTEWNKICVDRGWLADERWEAFDQNYSAQVNQPNCSKDLVRRFHRRAYRKWFISHRGLWFVLRYFRPQHLRLLWNIIKDHIKL